MNEGLLQTKLLIPILRSPSLVARPRLFDKLNAGLGGAITLVAAPAGFGKTTLVAEWVRREARFPGADKNPPVAWVSLDRQDNDLARFLTYLIAALNSVLGGGDDRSLAAPQGPQMPSAETIITPLINVVGQVPEPLILVLDDYHVIREQRIHDLIAFLLEHLPPSLHLVLVSRADPPLPLARLRGQGALNDVRQSDLCFTNDETMAFLNELLGLDLAAADLQRLNRRTEGWPAGLQMAALSLRQQEDPAAFIQAFTGSNRYILDYLMEEVLAQQQPDVQQFLLVTSVLERLTAPLCAALLEVVPGGSGEAGASILEYLDEANLFVVPLDDQRRWYRYHRLFADLLRQRLHETEPDLVPLLHARARDWTWREGWQAEAIDHALQAGDDDAAARLIAEAAESAFQKSQLLTVLRWIEALPEEQVRQDPRLSLYYAWALFLSGAPVDGIEARLPQLAGQSSAGVNENELPPAMALMHAFIAAMRGQMERAGELAGRALDGIDPDDRFWRSMAAWVLSISFHEPTAASPAGDWTWEDAIHIARESENLLVMVSAMCEQAHAVKRHGRLQDARDLFTQALALATPVGEDPLPVAGEALMGLAEIDLEWDDLESAELLLAEGLTRSRQWREVAALPGYFQLTRLRQAQGDIESADAALREAARLAVLFDATELDDVVVAAYQARLSIMTGRPDLAQSWVGDRVLSTPGLGMAETEEQVKGILLFEELILARLWLAQGEFDGALLLLDRILPEFAAWQYTRLIIETHLLRARAFAARGEQEKALATLQEALILGEPGAFIRMFVDEGERILHLLQILRAQNQGPQVYVSRLIAAFGKTLPDRPSQPLIEPLSERELEILRLIAEGLSNREIGQRLFLSLSTVKWHTSNIYGKLGVKNRTTAVAKARDLNIFP